MWVGVRTRDAWPASVQAVLPRHITCRQLRRSRALRFDGLSQRRPAPLLLEVMLESDVMAPEEFRLTCGGETFGFLLHRKSIYLGTTPVQHFWMDTRTLYSARPSQTGNSAAVVRYFGALCSCHQESGDAIERTVWENYLLARLLPYIRQYGSRRVLPDSRFGRSGAAYRGSAAAMRKELKELREQSRGARCERDEFRRRSGDLLGMPIPDERMQTFYELFTTELFSEPHHLLERGDTEAAAERVVSGWNRAMETWGRGHDTALQRSVLDILSYESRAAFHRCYSAVWEQLLREGGPLNSRLAHDTPSIRFLHLWHKDHFWPVGTDQLQHLFHGHVFALHPAMSLFMQCEEGRAMLGRVVTASDDDSYDIAFEQFLQGVLMAMYVYAGQRKLIAQTRKVDHERDRLRSIGRRHQGCRRRKPRNH